MWSYVVTYNMVNQDALHPKIYPLYGHIPKIKIARVLMDRHGAT